MKIKVTQEHIDKGARKRCQHCPVALAISEAILPSEKYYSVSVAPTNIVFEGVDEEGMIDTPASVANFIRAYDAKIPVEPFEFDLPI